MSSEFGAAEGPKAALLCGFKGVTVSPKSEEFKFFHSSPTRLYLLSGKRLNSSSQSWESSWQANTFPVLGSSCREMGKIVLHPLPQEDGVSQSPEPQPGLTQFLCWFKINTSSFSIHFWLWNLQFQQIYIIFYYWDVLQQPKQIPLPLPLWKVNY